MLKRVSIYTVVLISFIFQIQAAKSHISREQTNCSVEIEIMQTLLKAGKVKGYNVPYYRKLSQRYYNYASYILGDDEASLTAYKDNIASKMATRKTIIEFASFLSDNNDASIEKYKTLIKSAEVKIHHCNEKYLPKFRQTGIE